MAKAIKTKKTLFDHIKTLTTVNDPYYYDNLSDEDKKTYSVYMINRFLSMNSEWIEFINEVQIYSQLKSNGIHRVYNEVIPKKKIFLTYIKPNTEKKYNSIVIDVLKKYYELGSDDVKSYYDILINLPDGKEKIMNIVKNYGFQEKELKKIEKEL